MRLFTKYFLRGVFTLLPFGLTVILLFSFLNWTEQLSSELLSDITGGFYFPGLGLIIGVFLICVLGFLTTLPFMSKVVPILELPFKNVPILKSVYSAIKSLSDYFSPEGDKADQQVVIVRFPGFGAEMIGLVTRHSLSDMPKQFNKQNTVAVFLPLSYIVGGLTVFVPREYIHRVDMKVEEAMRSALTAWMPAQKNADAKSDF